MAKQDDYIKTALRLPSDLHARVQLAAEKAGRSMNAELIHRLEMSFEKGRTVEFTIHADMSLTMKELNAVLVEIGKQIAPDQAMTLNVLLDKAS